MSTPPATDDEEMELIRQVLAGEVPAVIAFVEAYRPLLESTLGARADTQCARHGIPEVLDQLMAECVAPVKELRRGGTPAFCLLERYLHPVGGGGRGPFQAWLRLTAKRRFLDWVKANCRFVPLEEWEEPTESTEPAGDDVANLVAEALQHGFAEAVKRQPAGVLSLLMEEVYKVQGQQLARALCISGGNVTRAKARAGAVIAEETMLWLRQADPWLDLDWSGVLRLLDGKFLQTMLQERANP